MSTAGHHVLRGEGFNPKLINGIGPWCFHGKIESRKPINSKANLSQ